MLFFFTDPPATPKVFPSTVFPWFENQTEQIICRSDPEGNPPPTTYEWFPTKGSSMQDTNSDADGHLTFHQVNRKHNLQEFYCVATNQFTQMTEKLVKSKEITVHVTCKFSPFIILQFFQFLFLLRVSLN